MAKPDELWQVSDAVREQNSPAWRTLPFDSAVEPHGRVQNCHSLYVGACPIADPFRATGKSYCAHLEALWKQEGAKCYQFVRNLEGE